MQPGDLRFVFEKKTAAKAATEKRDAYQTPCGQKAAALILHHGTGRVLVNDWPALAPLLPPPAWILAQIAALRQ